MMAERLVVRVVSAEIAEDGRYLITQRLAGAVLPLLWEFPGGRVRTGESDRDALVRSLEDRLGVRAEIGELVMEVEHPYEGYDLTMVVYRAELPCNPRTVRVRALAWALPEDFEQYEFPGADQQTVDQLIQ